MNPRKAVSPGGENVQHDSCIQGLVTSLIVPRMSMSIPPNCVKMQLKEIQG